MTQRFRHLLPVVLGGDIGAYALARQLHEVTGTSVTVVASDPIVAISESVYITVVHQEAGPRRSGPSRCCESWLRAEGPAALCSWPTPTPRPP